MKQRGDGSWSGHHDITYAAVARLYQHLSAPDGTLHGLRRDEYAAALDKAQAHQDRPVGAGLIENFKGMGLSYPYAGPGPTTHSAYANPNAQREHFMADPYRKGWDNLGTNVEYVHEQLAAAHGASDAEFTHLGAAAHALQDSYSGAHAWREDSVYDGDPAAPVQSLHVFTPMHAVGIADGKNTHADEFDKPPAASGSTRAAIEATYRMLRSYELHRNQEPGAADRARRTDLAPMLRPAASGVTVNLHPTGEWAAERDRRIGLERASAEPGSAPGRSELDRLSAVLAATADPARITPTTGAPAARPGVSGGISSEGVGRGG
ncbi:hypothetical protein AB0L64_26605 [Kribbella sp. NPDC051936]|uniref:hypothetical protein n=1 Tax=Kribbella sp. NPDC051936 TaxID=3154946 RepID=UPI00341C93E3